MKNKPLKHYNRKKFFYRFFMRKSPRSGAMFGLAWMIFFGAILPISPWIFFKITPDWVSDSDCIVWLLVAVLFFSVWILIYAYGFLTFVKNFYTILRNDLKKSRWWKLLAFISAVRYEIAGILLMPIVIKKKRWAALLFISACFGFGFAGFMLDTPLQKWYCWHGGVAISLLSALAVSGKDKKFSWRFVYPLLLFAFFVIKLYWLDYCFNVHIFSKKYELGRTISAEDWKKRNSYGYSINKEPLKSFCKINMEIDMEKYQTPTDAQKFLAELRKTHTDKFVAIDRLLELKPQRISYNWVNPGEPGAAMLLPDLQCFRTAARLRNLEILANAKDKAMVAKCNQDMLKFRKWCFYNETLIGKLVAVVMESLRLDALSYAIASGVYSKDEIVKLIDDAPDWGKQFSEIFASENALTEDCLEALKNVSGDSMPSYIKNYDIKTFWRLYQKFAPLFIRMNLKRDHLFTLNHYLKIRELLSRNDLSGIEKAKLAKLDKDYLWCECFAASMMAIPDLYGVLLRIDRIRNTRQMALLAAEVMEYRKQHGKLPDDLTFLPEIPLSKLDHKPLMYEKTKDGFRIFSHTDKGKKPDAEDWQYSYLVRLDGKK